MELLNRVRSADVSSAIEEFPGLLEKADSSVMSNPDPPVLPQTTGPGAGELQMTILAGLPFDLVLNLYRVGFRHWRDSHQ